MIDVATIKAALDCGRSACTCRGNGQTHCPAHDDQHPSLTIKAGKHVPVIVTCHAGCAPEAVIAALTERGLWPDSTKEPLRGLWAEPKAPIPIHKPRGTLRLVKEYAYADASSTTIAVKGRFEDGAGYKEFRWRLPAGRFEDGLGGLAMADLPLYRLPELLATTGAVVLTEGEKACDALVNSGIVAVSLAGGGSQKDFGAALDPLKTREVWLFPDNDPVGRDLMRRLAVALPGAKHVALPADMPAKGDAVEYLAAGHDVAELFAVKDGPTATVNGDCVTVTVPHEGGHVRFEFADIATRAQKFDADLTVTPAIVGYTDRSFNAHLQLKSLSSLAEYRRTLDATYGKDLPWALLLSDACQLAKSTYLSATVAIDIETVAVDFETRYRVAGVVPEEGTTIIFGQGSSSKTYNALELANCINAGRPFLGHDVRQAAILYLDYEAAHGPIARRRHRLILGGPDVTIPPGMFHYMPGRGIPIADQMPAVQRELRRTRASVLIIDSAVSALGGDPKDAEAVGRMMAALNALGVSVILIAHVTKEGGDEYPFGSIFFHNLARMSWFIRRVDSEESPDIQVGFFNKKSNDDRRQKAFGVAIRFDDPAGPVTVEACDVAEVPDLASGLSVSARVMHVLGRGPRTTSQLAEECQTTAQAIRTTCQRLGTRLRGSIITGEKEKTWTLLSTRVEVGA